LEVEKSEREIKIKEQEKIILEKDHKISGLESSVKTKIDEIDQMQKSVIWQLVTKYHNGFVERLLPHGTRRRGCMTWE